MPKYEPPSEFVGNDGARMGHDEDGAYMIGSDGSYMRMGKKGAVIVASDGSTLSKPRPRKR